MESILLWTLIAWHNWASVWLDVLTFQPLSPTLGLISECNGDLSCSRGLMGQAGMGPSHCEEILGGMLTLRFSLCRLWQSALETPGLGYRNTTACQAQLWLTGVLSWVWNPLVLHQRNCLLRILSPALVIPHVTSFVPFSIKWMHSQGCRSMGLLVGIHRPCFSVPSAGLIEGVTPVCLAH